MLKLPLTAIVLCCLCLSISGCWDRRELQDRNFVLAVGIDTADAGAKTDQNTETTKLQTFVQPHGDKRYRLSLQILKIGADPKKKDKTFILSNTGESLFEMTRDMLGQSSKSIWFEHIQAIVISEAVVKRDRLDTILDFFLRDSEMRSRINVYITPNEARSILEYQPHDATSGGLFLGENNQNHMWDNHIIHHADLGFIDQTIRNKGDVIIPRLELLDNGIKIGGAAAFKKDKFVGYLDEYAILGGKFTRATEKTAVITATGPDHPENVFVFEMTKHDTRLTPHVDGDNIYFTLDITMSGNINELQNGSENSGYDLFKPEDIRKLELVFSEEVKQAVEYNYRINQQLGTDNLLLNAKLKTQKPAVWSKVKNRWDDIFPTIPLIVSVNTSIQGIGKHK